MPATPNELLRKELEKTLKQRDEYQDRLNSALSKIEELNSDKTQLLNEVNAQTEYLSKIIKYIQEQEVRFLVGLATEKKNSRELQKKIAIQEEKLCVYQQTLKTKQFSLQELETEKEDLATKLKEKEKEIKIIQVQTRKLQTELGKTRKEYWQIAAKLDEEKEKLLDVSLTEEKLQVAKENISRLEKELAEAEEKLEAGQSAVLNLRKELVDKEKIIKQVRAEKQIEIDELQAEKDKLQLEFASLQTKLESNKKELKKKNQELSDTKKTLVEQKQNKSIRLTRVLRKRKGSLKKEVEKLEGENVNLEEELAEKSKRMIIIDSDINANALQIKPDLKHPPIGRGGYGEVYYGKWQLQDVAVKKLYSSNSISQNQNDVKEINNEINILKNLRNRYIIQYYGVYYDNQVLLIIMDYAENGTLTKFINDNKEKEHNWNFNNELIRQITTGLAYIHQNDIIHRDLKSMNILLTKNYEVRISDFGLSRTKNISFSYSKHGARGTLGWMAPELLRDIRNPKYSEQSDIYALGMIIWEIAAKCTEPFKDIIYKLVALHIVDNGRETIPNDTPKNIQDIIQKCWKGNPEERINLESILKIIENKNKIVNSPIVHTNHPLEISNSPKPLNANEQEESKSLFVINENEWLRRLVECNDETSQGQNQTQVEIPPKGSN